MRYAFCLFIGLATFVGLASPCSAQGRRTYVSSGGSDNNGCTVSSPCQSFAAALSKTPAGGEVDCLGDGDFGAGKAVTITQAVSIVCDGTNGGLTSVQSDAAIDVNLSSAGDKVILSGLNLSTGARVGVQMSGTGTLTIRNSQITGDYGAGVDVVATSAVRVLIQNAYIANDHTGVNVESARGTRVVIRDSLIENNTYGVNAATSSVAILRTLIDGNSSYALGVGASGSAAALEDSVLSGSPAGISNAGGTVNSFGQSNLITGTGSPTASTPLR